MVCWWVGALLLAGALGAAGDEYGDETHAVRRRMARTLADNVLPACIGTDGRPMLDRLLDGYVRMNHPVDPVDQDPVSISVTATVTKINEFNTKQQSFKINMYFRQKWVDKRLQWNESEYCGIKALPDIPPGRIWQPDTFFANANSIQSPDGEEYLRLDNSGTVLWSKRIVLAMFCSMTFEWFPFDTQECVTRIESYAYGPDVIQYSSPEEGDRYDTAVEFLDGNVGTVASYVLTQPRSEVELVEIGGNKFSGVTFHWTFYRKKGRYIITAFSQIWLICITSYAGCFVNPEAAPARVALALIAVLTIINLLTKLTSDVPVVPYITAMDILYLITITAVVANVLEYCLVNFMLTRIKKKEQKVAELKRRRGAASKAARYHPPTKRDLARARAEVRELFDLYDTGYRGTITKEEFKSLVQSAAADRGRVLEDAFFEGETRALGREVTLDDAQSMAVEGALSDKVGIEAENRSSVTFCGIGVVRRTIDNVEALWRVWAPTLWVIANIIWFTVVLGQNTVVSIIVTVLLLLFYFCGLYYAIRSRFGRRKGGVDFTDPDVELNEYQPVTASSDTSVQKPFLTELEPTVSGSPSVPPVPRWTKPTL